MHGARRHPIIGTCNTDIHATTALPVLLCAPGAVACRHITAECRWYKKEKPNSTHGTLRKVSRVQAGTCAGPAGKPQRQWEQVVTPQS